MDLSAETKDLYGGAVSPEPYVAIDLNKHVCQSRAKALLLTTRSERCPDQHRAQ